MNRRNERLALAGVLAAGALLLVRHVLFAPATLAVGAVRSEAPRHLWGLWATAERLTEWGPLVAHLEAAWPDGYTRHLMDPVNLLVFLPGWLLGGGGVTGATLGWNLLHVVWPVVGGLGSWLLVRRLLGERDGAVEGALVAAFAGAAGPMLLATPWLGRSELLPGVMWPLHLWLLMGVLDAERLRPGRVVAAGLSLAGVALGGWYLAAWLLLLEPVVALGMAWRQRDRGAGALALRLGLVAVVAVLPVLPALWAVLAYPPPVMGEEARVALHQGVSVPPWMLLPFVDEKGLPGVDLPAYPGWALLLLGAWGAARDRAARPWLGLGAVMLVLSLGPMLVTGRGPVEPGAGGLPLPAAWIEAVVPPLRFIWGWCRIGILVTGPLAVAAAYGVADLAPRLGTVRREALLGVLLLMAIEHGVPRRPGGVSGDHFDPRPPAALGVALDALPAGAIVQLPFDDHAITWQLSHGRPVAESLEIEPIREQSWIVQQAVFVENAARDGAPAPESSRGAAARACAQADAAALRDAGWAGVVLHKDRMPGAHAAVAAFLASTLGPPAVDGPEVAAWAFPAGGGGEACPLRPVRDTLPAAPPG